MKNEASNRIRRFNFLNIFLEDRISESFYESLGNCLNNQVLFENNAGIQNPDSNSIYEIRDFPGYLMAGPWPRSDWKIKSVNTFKGSCIYLGNYLSAEDFLKKKFSPKRRSRLRTYKKRLEGAFDIQYRSYYGSISKDEYRSILNDLKELIIKRFDELNSDHDDLYLWDHYYKIAYDLILNKQAVLFVILRDEKPINIALNLIYGNLMFSYIRGFDTDYSKFYPGFIDFSEQVKWAFEHRIEVFDLLKGRYEYKDRLKDREYYFQRQILYRSNNRSSRIIASILHFKNSLIYFFYRNSIKFGGHKIYHWLKRNNNHHYAGAKHLKMNYTVNKLVTHPPSDELIRIDISSGEFEYLKRPVYDFLYAAKDNFTAVKVFQLKTKPNTYFISGIEQNRMISITAPKKD